jgi:thiol-disulfide isomerase/thioredoxin
MEFNDNLKNEELGGRRRNHMRRHSNKKQHKKKLVVVGKVYAEWCGHCQTLKPEWIKMKTHIHTKRGNKHISFAEIEEKEIETKLRKLEKDHGVKIEANGYPTLFRIENGHIKYYNGERTSNQMMDWFLKGDDGVISPMTTAIPQMQGGKYRHKTQTHRKYYNSRHRRHHRRFRYTRKNRSDSSKGLFGFLFGK